jgi:hypothetical protein
LAPSLTIEVAGTSPAMTRLYVLIKNDRNLRYLPYPAMLAGCRN